MVVKRRLLFFLGALLLAGLLLTGCARKDSGTAGEVSVPPAGQVTRPESYQDIFGVYNGRIDNSFIEIQVDQGQAFPGSDAATAFLFPLGQSAGLAADIKTGDRVKLNCFKNSSGQWQITSLEKEKGAGCPKDIPALGEGDFTVKSGQRSVKLGTSDRDVNLEEVFGKVLSENTVRLGADAGTLAGSYVKNQVYDGIEVGLLSKGGKGGPFKVDTMHITGGAHATARGIMVGDSYTRILELYPAVNGKEPAREDPRNRSYSYASINEGEDMFLSFEVRDGIIRSITLQVEHS
ncbi:MAG TPA: hypothetical protein PL078_03250 [Bacillota bacterium]|nr:hypothetical protein [Peptococcaceae bacterium MAG4]NLW38329.1 hypothetical protein [Peptococcaceae bacterium]HPZ43000.1 hypothetical protein [Bacillota bacterium]HQD75388.1 hypothetical protein [Bacillota bacterium]HUM58109.1 hypothetical protein [Bacillota bacterium]